MRTAYTIDDQESFATARELLRAEGILGGSSTGTLLAAALRYCRAQTTPKRVVTFVCDTGTRYLSKVYNDQWMIDQGLLARQRFGDLRDLVSRRAEDGGVDQRRPDDTLLTAFQRMRAGRRVATAGARRTASLAGMLDESDLLLHVSGDPIRFQAPVRQRDDHAHLSTLAPDAEPATALDPMLDRGLVAIVADATGFHGLITRFDLLNHLRRTLP